MDTILQSQVFFFISSIGFVTLWIFIAILLYYLIRATKTFSKILSKMEKDIDAIGDTTKEMIEEVRDSAFFRLIFKKKKSRNNKS